MKDRFALLEEFFMAWKVLHAISDKTDYAEERKRLFEIAEQLEAMPKYEPEPDMNAPLLPNYPGHKSPFEDDCK